MLVDTASQARVAADVLKFVRRWLRPILSVAPTRSTRKIIPMMNPKSPMRLVMNAFARAQAFAASVYQKPMSR